MLLNIVLQPNRLKRVFTQPRPINTSSV